MFFPRICVLFCLPLLACAADKGDDTTLATTADASATSGTTSADTGPVSTSDAETSASATTAESTTGDEGTTGAAGTTGEGTTGAVGTTGDGTTGEGTSTGEPAGLSWALDVYPVFVVEYCGDCHAVNSGNLKMSNPIDSYNDLVGAKSYQTVEKMYRVVPGDPDKSYLLYKLNGTQEDVGGGGFNMPIGMKLPQSSIDLVAQWISDGALP